LNIARLTSFFLIVVEKLSLETTKLNASAGRGDTNMHAATLTIPFGLRGTTWTELPWLLRVCSKQCNTQVAVIDKPLQEEFSAVNLLLLARSQTWIHLHEKF
jgi:hypothetical protein